MNSKILIEVENFGPIGYSKLNLNDLTIFIGPNNTGKSYAAMLIYQLLRTLSRIAIFSSSFYSFRRHLILDSYFEESEQRFIRNRRFPFKIDLESMTGDITDFLKKYQEQLNSDKEIEIPKDIIENFHNDVLKSIKLYVLDNLTNEFKRIYACSLKELTKFGNECFKVTLTSEEIEIVLECDEKKIISKSFKIEIPTIYMSKKLLKRDQKFFLRYKSSTLEIRDNFKFSKKISLEATSMEILERMIEIFLDGIRKKLQLIPSRIFYYLPATRAGLIQGQKAISSAFYRLSSRALIDPINIPTLSGIISDFLVKIIEIGRKKVKYKNLVEFLEQKLTKGKIEYISDENGVASEIMYITDEGEIPLYRASSMISELAPIVLYFKHIIDSKCFIIIEEPEAHLHPDAQRIFAQFIVKLIRAGLKVLITTHSDFLILQLNNFIRLSKKTPKLRTSLNYDKNDFIKHEEVNTFLFQYNEKMHGISTEDLETTEFGIDEDHFAQLTDQLYGESTVIDKR